MRLSKLMVPVAAVALGVTACGGDDSPSAEETPASGETAEETPEDEAGGAEGSGDGSTEDESDTGDSGSEVDAAELFGEISEAVLEAGSYEFESSMSAGGQEMAMAGAIQVGTDVSETNMRIQADVMGASTTILIVDGQFYMEPSESMGMPEGMGSWMTVDPEASDAFSEQMTQSFDDIGSATDLTAQLAEHPDLLTVREVGSATVEEVETTEYLVTVNDIAEFQGVPEEEVQTEEQVFRMWIDGDNLPRRYETEGGSGPDSMTFSNYGADVEVEAPPEDEVVDMSELMNQ